MSKVKAQLASIGAMIKNVKALIDLRILQFSETEPNAYLFREIWYNKDRRFKLEFCKNLLTYWHISRQTSIDQLQEYTLAVFDKETGDLMATYHMKNGLYLV